MTSFLPADLPHGWTAPNGIHQYGTADHPGKNGTIFDYINGGGVVYVDHGFRAMSHVEYVHDESGTMITADVFDMVTPENASAAFNDVTICPEGYTAGSGINNAKEYVYSPDYFLYFQRAHYLIYVALSDDRELETARQVAASINRLITWEGKDETDR